MIDDLRLDSLPGVGPVTTRKLSDAGVHNIMDLIVRGPVELAEITGMDKDTSATIVEKARQALVEGGWWESGYDQGITKSGAWTIPDGLPRYIPESNSSAMQMVVH